VGHLRAKEARSLRAVVYDRYGPPEVLRLEDVERPTPSEDEVLVRVHATTVNRTDAHTREANRRSGAVASLISRLITGPLRPRQRILGNEFAGVIEAVGSAVRGFSIGDRVFGTTKLRFGAHAEYLCVSQSTRMALISDRTSFTEAAAISDGALSALMVLKPAALAPGRRILIYGASGAIGTAAVQLARHFGADITAVCGTKNIERVKSLGANRVLDYTREDFTRSGETYDVILDAVGKMPFTRCLGSLEPAGMYLPTDGMENLIRVLLPSRPGAKRVVFPMPPRQSKEDLAFIRGLVEAGAFRPVIDRTYRLEEVVEATRYVETEQKTGNVILLVHDDGPRP
jgi:NADPH:quinone reductase-like Zn-dependent oxidoreductase